MLALSARNTAVVALRDRAAPIAMKYVKGSQPLPTAARSHDAFQALIRSPRKNHHGLSVLAVAQRGWVLRKSVDDQQHPDNHQCDGNKRVGQVDHGVPLSAWDPILPPLRSQ